MVTHVLQREVKKDVYTDSFTGGDHRRAPYGYADMTDTYPGGAVDHMPIHDFVNDLDACYDLMEEALERRGLTSTYALELAQIVEGKGLFALIHASPRERVMAALRTVGVA